MSKTPMARLHVDLLIDHRALEFVLGVIESAEIADLPAEVADDVVFVGNMIGEAIKRCRERNTSILRRANVEETK